MINKLKAEIEKVKYIEEKGAAISSDVRIILEKCLKLAEETRDKLQNKIDCRITIHHIDECNCCLNAYRQIAKVRNDKIQEAFEGSEVGK